ncbi:MAG TPA: VanW family protein [Bacillota bacterium]
MLPTLLLVLGTGFYAVGPGLGRVTEALLLKGLTAPGLRVLGTPIGHLSRDETLSVLLTLSREYRGRLVLLRYGPLVLKESAGSLGATLDAAATLERVWGIGRSGGLGSRLANVLWGDPGGREVPPVIRVDQADLHDALVRLAREVDLQPANATIDPGNGKASPATPGRRLIFEATERTIRAIVADSVSPEPAAAELTVEGLPPRVTTGDLTELGPQMIGRYATYFDQAVIGRSRNIARSARSLDGLLLHPGDVFSFNEAVGPTDADHGYEEAPEIFKGRFVTGIGGGVCQLSSTLYNSALLAGLEIIERYNHSRVLPYIPPGRDATVNYGGADFRFRNSTSFPLQVRAVVAEGGVATFFIGQRPPGPEIDIETYDREEVSPEVKEIVDQSLAPGARLVDEAPVAGLKIRVARVYRQGGREIRRETISHDLYPPLPEVVRVGPSPGGKGGEEQRPVNPADPSAGPPTDAPANPADERLIEGPSKPPAELKP